MQFIESAQEIPPSKTESRVRLGLGLTDQLVPFHVSMSVRSGRPREYHEPTLTQLVALVHVTEESPSRCLGRLGIGVTVQLVPSQNSISGIEETPG